MKVPRTNAEWKAAFAPYDEATYQAALDALQPDDVVLDIGAGDLRFAKRAARRVKRVIALEQRADSLGDAAAPNLEIFCGDARVLEFPNHITAAVLLMRHCQHFALYREKLERVACQRLITNARWSMAVDAIALNAPRSSTRLRRAAGTPANAAPSDSKQVWIPVASV